MNFIKNHCILSFWAAGYESHTTTSSENNFKSESDFFIQFNNINKHNNYWVNHSSGPKRWFPANVSHCRSENSTFQNFLDQNSTSNPAIEQHFDQNHWISCQIDGFWWDFTKKLQLAEQISPRVFRVGWKQNILGVSTRRDLFESGIVSKCHQTFKKVFWS